MEDSKVYTGADFETARPVAEKQDLKPIMENSKVYTGADFELARPDAQSQDLKHASKGNRKMPTKAKAENTKTNEDEISPVDKFLLARPSGKSSEGAVVKKPQNSKSL